MDSRLRHPTRTLVLDLTLLIVLVVSCYGIRLTDLSIRGEESRWATVAMEMVRRGDIVVPRQQGQPFLSRPPMGSWLIAAAALARGECDPWAVRLPSLLAVLGTTLIIYGYARSFLGRVGALGSAAAFASMPEILQMGRLAESDAVFTFFLGGAFLVWHWGYSRQWPGALTWGIAYLLLGCATLTKGPQAPVYFGLTVGLNLIWSGQWRRLVTGSHLFGLLLYAAIVGLWLVPFWARMGFADTWRIIAGDSTDRFVGLKWREVAAHFGQYPLEILGCTGPWSYLLAAFASRRFRHSLADAGPHARFLIVAWLVGFPTCWATPGGQTRYLMPLYPCVAVLAGIVIDRAAAASLRLQRVFAGLKGLTVACIIGLAIALVGLTWCTGFGPWKQPPYSVVMAAAAAGAAALIWHNGPFSPGRVRPIGLVALAGLLGMAYSGMVVNHLAARSEHGAEAVAALKRIIPADARIASLGPTHHKFAYEFGQPIELLPDDGEAVRMVPPGGWLCYVAAGETRRSFPFCVEEVAAISMDRHHFEHPQVQVIVVRRSGGSTLASPKQIAQRQP